jgi:hypothetical protein
LRLQASFSRLFEEGGNQPSLRFSETGSMNLLQDGDCRFLLSRAVRAIVVLLCLAAPNDSPGEDLPRGILIEAEDYDRKLPDEEAFASPAHEAAASGRAVLARFFQGKHVTYVFAAPEKARYTAWLRYAATRDMVIQVAVDPAAEPGFAKVRLTGTGALSGPNAWRWAPLFQAELAPGEHAFAIAAAGFRPDAIFISTSDEPPTDQFIRRDPLAGLDAETRMLLEKPAVEMRPDWLDQAADYRLPAWYDEHRVQAHTRLGTAYMTKDVFLNAAAGFREMGADVFVRHIQAHTQGAWWPSKVAAIHPLAENRNLAKEIIDDAHRTGCRLIVYHVHMYDRLLGAEHPDWVCRDPSGEPIGHNTMPFMCYNSPYPDLYLQRALELVDLGADGFYFDFVHMPKTGCWCDNCRREFKRATGLDHPQRVDAEDPLWRKLAEFNDGVIERTFLKWREGIHRRNPECVMLISSHLWSGMTDHHLNNRLFRIADSVKMEFSIPIRTGPNRIFSVDPSLAAPEPDVRLALGYTLARDAADGRPSHIWTHGLLDEAATLYATAGMVAHGCIANLDVPESTIPNPMFKKAFELGGRISPYFAATSPTRWAAIHFAEQARDALAPDESRQWKEVLYPLYGVYRTLLRAHLPVGVVTDSQLEEGRLDGYRVLFLPVADRLTPRMKAAVEAFQSSGGLVIEQREGWQWHAPDGGLERAATAFMAEASPQLAAAPVRVTGGPEKMHAVSFTARAGNRLTVALVNDFSWVYTGQKPDPERIAELTETPQPCRGVTIGIRSDWQPRRVFDAVSGKTLAVESRPQGLTIRVPDFDCLSVVVVEL